MRTTIKDVARLSGFSVSTVSLVLNNKPVSIPRETRQIILKAAKELHYRPNQLAVGLVTKKTNTLGLIIPDNSNLFFAAYSNKIEIAANELGYNVIFGNTNNSPKKNLHYLQIFADRNVDGIILAQSEFSSQRDTDECLALVQSMKVPIILIDRMVKQPPFEHVTLDHFKGGCIATKHLLSLGHKRIGCVTGPKDLTYCTERLNGYKHALSEAGFEFDPTLLREGDMQVQGGADALPYLLDKNVSAVVAFNDMMAFGIYKEVRKYNVRIPDDLSVIGFDDIFFTDVISPPLTTVIQPLENMAIAAVSGLVDRIRGKSRRGSLAEVFVPDIVVRGSTKSLI